MKNLQLFAAQKRVRFAGTLLLISLFWSALCIAEKKATGPLVVSTDNPRYFVSPEGKAVYLTGSHTWANLQDIGIPSTTPPFDYDAYLELLSSHNHNFIRLWAWEHAAFSTGSDKKVLWLPSPYERTGPGTAIDGGEKFDLTKFYQKYFDRLRDRVIKADERGIYVGIMLFQGWSSKKSWLPGDPFRGHPFNKDNNVNGINGDKNGDSNLDLNDPEVRKFHAAYIQKIIETVNDLDNVLFEVTNEGGNKDWDWWVVDTVHKFEITQSRRHPVGITGHGGEHTQSMLDSPSEWLSPGSNDCPELKTDPPVWKEKKPALLDTDHVWGIGGSRQWVWKCFLRGYNPIFMDPWRSYRERGADSLRRSDYPQWEPARKALGQARKYADKINLLKAIPSPELSSTGYCLAQPGSEYLVYQSAADTAFSVQVLPGKYSYEWFNAALEVMAETGTMTIESTSKIFKAPFSGADAVLLLKRE